MVECRLPICPGNRRQSQLDSSQRPEHWGIWKACVAQLSFHHRHFDDGDESNLDPDFATLMFAPRRTTACGVCLHCYPTNMVRSLVYKVSHSLLVPSGTTRCDHHALMLHQKRLREPCGITYPSVLDNMRKRLPFVRANINGALQMLFRGTWEEGGADTPSIRARGPAD